MKIGKYVNQYCYVQHDERRMEFRQCWRMNLADKRLLYVFVGMAIVVDVVFMSKGVDVPVWGMIMFPLMGALFVLFGGFVRGFILPPGRLTSKVIIDETGVCLKTKRKGETLIRWEDVTRIERHRVQMYDYTWLLIGNSMNECIKFYYSEEIEEFIFEMHPECKQMLKVLIEYVGPGLGG